MKIKISGTPKEIADLVLGIQSQQNKDFDIANSTNSITAQNLYNKLSGYLDQILDNSGPTDSCLKYGNTEIDKITKIAGVLASIRLN